MTLVDDENIFSDDLMTVEKMKWNDPGHMVIKSAD